MERRSFYSSPCKYEFDRMSYNGNTLRSYVWATYSLKGAQPPGHLQIYRRDRGVPQIVSLQGSASSTETAMNDTVCPGVIT